MQAELVVRPEQAARTVAVATARRAVRSGAIWGLVFGLSVAAIIASYASAFPTPVDRALLAASFSHNAGLAALYGKARALDTVAGFTAWRTGAIVWIGAIWGLFAATRLTRGEEDAGRWELFLAGRTTRRATAAQALVGLAAGWAVLWAVTTAFTVAVGTRSTIGFSRSASVYFATSLVAAAAMFLAVGALVSQLAATRRQANLVGGLVLGASWLIRTVADAGAGLDALRWASPLGWVENLRPLTGTRPIALVPIIFLIAGCVVATVAVAGRRDLGASIIPGRDVVSPRTRLLGSLLGLATRLTRPVLLAWAAGLAVVGLVFGLVARSAAEAVSGSAGVEKAIERLGGVRGGVAAFLGLMFVVAAAFLAFVAAGQIAAVRKEESDGHLEVAFARPVARWRWLAGRVAVGVAMVIVCGLVIGIAAWIGSVSQGGGVGFGEMVRAGLNITPAALFVLGVGVLLYGLWPRAAPGVAYGLVAWSFLVEILSSVLTGNRWLLDSSLLHYIAPVPAADPDSVAAAWLVGLGVLAAVAGIVAFGRRDLAGA